MSIPEPTWISREAVEFIHARQLERYGGSAGIIDENVVESALARPRNRWHYSDEADLAEIAAGYLYGFACTQGFSDGNKRTALAAMLVFLDINGRPLDVAPAELYRVAIGVARNEISEPEIAEWLRRNGCA